MNKGTTEGTVEEVNLVVTLNRKNKVSYWKILDLNPDDCFAIHVIGHKFGKINGAAVKPKADIFIARGSVPPDRLRQDEYYLNESSIDKYKLLPLKFTGISVKRVDSYNYQITKMNPSTFKKIFGAYELGAGASIYCKKYSDLDRNNSVIRGWMTGWPGFNKYFQRRYNIDAGLLNDSSGESKTRLSIAKTIKQHSNKEIERKINNNKRISDFIFQGIGNFEEPYTAHWLYEHGILKKAGPIQYCVTTGSGRSRGDFTVVIKPVKH